MKNTFILIMLIFLELLGVTFSLILLYASPTEHPQILEASIAYFGTSILIASILYHISFHQERDNLLRLIFILLSILLIIYSLILTLIITYASPDTINPTNPNAILLFLLSSFIIFVGCIFMLLHNPKESSNEK